MKLAALNEQKQGLPSRLADKQAALDNMPDEKTIERQRKEMLKVVCELLQRMPFSDKRKVLQEFFKGKDEDGYSYGVYVHYTKQKDRYFFMMKGVFTNAMALLHKDKSKTVRVVSEDKDIPSELLKNAYTRIPGQEAIL